MSIMIIDYGMGNLTSVQRALEEAGAACFISDLPHDIKEASSIVLPGVGAFKEGMANLRSSGMADAILEAAKDNVPILGICLGMQLLATNGDEGGGESGLNLIPGTIREMKAQPGERIPHIGWNEINQCGEHPMYEGIKDLTDFYFVHSFHFDNTGDHTVTKTPYAGGFSSSVAHGNIWGTQFHPEKSSKAGLKLLENFINIPFTV